MAYSGRLLSLLQLFEFRFQCLLSMQWQEKWLKDFWFCGRFQSDAVQGPVRPDHWRDARQDWPKKARKMLLQLSQLCIAEIVLPKIDVHRVDEHLIFSVDFHEKA